MTDTIGLDEEKAAEVHAIFEREYIKTRDDVLALTAADLRELKLCLGVRNRFLNLSGVPVQRNEASKGKRRAPSMTFADFRALRDQYPTWASYRDAKQSDLTQATYFKRASLFTQMMEEASKGDIDSLNESYVTDKGLADLIARNAANKKKKKRDRSKQQD